eukprot:8506582-Pyramimonas_sp.AAC.1
MGGRGRPGSVVARCRRRRGRARWRKLITQQVRRICLESAMERMRRTVAQRYDNFAARSASSSTWAMVTMRARWPLVGMESRGFP